MGTGQMSLVTTCAMPVCHSAEWQVVAHGGVPPVDAMMDCQQGRMSQSDMSALGHTRTTCQPRGRGQSPRPLSCLVGAGS